MATVKCIKCGEEIAQTDVICPWCGTDNRLGFADPYVGALHHRRPGESVRQSQRAGRAIAWTFWIVLGTVALVVGVPGTFVVKRVFFPRGFELVEVKRVDAFGVTDRLKWSDSASADPSQARFDKDGGLSLLAVGRERSDGDFVVLRAKIAHKLLVKRGSSRSWGVSLDPTDLELTGAGVTTRPLFVVAWRDGSVTVDKLGIDVADPPLPEFTGSGHYIEHLTTAEHSTDPEGTSWASDQGIEVDVTPASGGVVLRSSSGRFAFATDHVEQDRAPVIDTRRWELAMVFPLPPLGSEGIDLTILGHRVAHWSEADL